MNLELRKKYFSKQKHRFTKMNLIVVNLFQNNMSKSGIFLTIFLISSIISFYPQHYSCFPARDRGDDINHLIPNYAILILWLQGGPGCADFTEYFQNGPVNVMSGISWDDEYHLFYIASSVGYSVAGNDLPTDSMQSTFHINNFIVRFFELYPSLKRRST